MSEHPEPDPRFLGGETAVLSDARDFALVLTISHDGVADVMVNGPRGHPDQAWDKPTCAKYLRYIADSWDPA